MTIEPQPQGADQPQPFAEEPRDPPGGCSRPVVIGCALTVILLGLVLLGLLWKAQDLLPALFRWSVDQVEEQVTANLPPDLGAGERQRLADAFDAAVTAVEEGTADPVALQRLQGVLLEVARGGRLSPAQVEELTAALEAVAGQGASPTVEPAPAAEPSPQPLAV